MNHSTERHEKDLSSYRNNLHSQKVCQKKDSCVTNDDTKKDFWCESQHRTTQRGFKFVNTIQAFPSTIRLWGASYARRELLRPVQWDLDHRHPRCCVATGRCAKLVGNGARLYLPAGIASRRCRSQTCIQRPRRPLNCCRLAPIRPQRRHRFCKIPCKPDALTTAPHRQRDEDSQYHASADRCQEQPACTGFALTDGDRRRSGGA